MRIKRTLHRLPLTKARVILGSLVRRIRRNKQQLIILEKYGTPVAALLDVNAYEEYHEMRDLELKEQIRQGYREYRKGRLTEDFEAYMARVRAKPKSRAKK